MSADSVHIVVSRGNESTDWREGYYPPLSDGDYQTGIVQHQISPAPGWRLLHTRLAEMSGYTPVNRALEAMVTLEGDGLRAYQTASLNHLLPADAALCLKTLWMDKELALSPRGLIVSHALADFSYWMGWERLKLCGLVEESGEYPSLSIQDKRKVYRYTGKGWLMSRLAAEVYQWAASV